MTEPIDPQAQAPTVSPEALSAPPPAPQAVIPVTPPPQPVLPDRPFDEKTATLVELKEVARLMAASTQFKDTPAHNPAVAFAKMMVGRDLGIPMTRALIDVFMVQGKPALSANLMAGMIKRSGRYKYKKLVHTDQECQIQVWEKIDGVWEDLGVSTFTIKDAEKAGLLKNPTWKNFPRNMLFSRVISNIAKQECGDVFLGSIYTPDEIDPTFQVNEDGEPVLPAKPKVTVRAAESTSALADDVVDAEVIEAPAGEESVTSVANDIRNLAAKTGWDLDGFLKGHRLKRLESLDLASLKNTRNTLIIKAKMAATAA